MIYDDSPDDDGHRGHDEHNDNDDSNIHRHM